MGVPGLWDILRPTAETHSLTHLTVVDGFLANPGGARGLRIGIDASIWFFHAAYGREGENPELRTLFFRCSRLMSMPFLPLFVFDGPKRPNVKRGKRITGKDHWLVNGMKGIIEAFGFEWRMAPGEAEAELAYLNSMGVIDAILSDDVDTFLFGATVVIRNPSATLSGNRAHAIKNSAGRDDGNHTAVYKSKYFTSNSSVKLTRGGLILIGLLSGGDYHQAGLPRCGPGIAHGLAKCGFGDRLLEAVRSKPEDQLPKFLDRWREDLRQELRTNSKGHLGSKKPSLAKAVPDDFPDVEVLLSYANPITSENDASAKRTHTRPTWEREPDLGKIAHLCEVHFEWGLKDIIIKRFRTVLWPSAVLRILRRAVLESDKSSNASIHDDPLKTPSKKGKLDHPHVIGTPSKMLAKHFSSMHLKTVDEDDDENEEQLIVKIHSTRTHAYTDGLLEYRLEIAPAQLVRLSESGIQGIRKPADTTYDVYASEEEDSDEESTGKKDKEPVDPNSHLRMWMPACMVDLVRPDLVEEFQQKKKKTKTRTKTKTGAEPKGKGRKKVTTAPKQVRDDDENKASCSESEGVTRPNSPVKPAAKAPTKTKTKSAMGSVTSSSVGSRSNAGSSSKHIGLAVRKNTAWSAESSTPVYDLSSDEEDLLPVMSCSKNVSRGTSAASQSTPRKPTLRPFPMAFNPMESESSQDEPDTLPPPPLPLHPTRRPLKAAVDQISSGRRRRKSSGSTSPTITRSPHKSPRHRTEHVSPVKTALSRRNPEARDSTSERLPAQIPASRPSCPPASLQTVTSSRTGLTSAPKAKDVDTTTIEISSDSDTGHTRSASRQKIPPLLVARSKAASASKLVISGSSGSSSRSTAMSRTTSSDVIDLT